MATPQSIRRSGLVLIVEDDVDLREALQGLLTEEGYRVSVAKSAFEALLGIETRPEKPSAILLDLMMPRMNGFQFLDEMRSKNHEIPVIVLSAYVNAEHEESLPPPVRLVMKKPVDVKLLCRALAGLCAES